MTKTRRENHLGFMVARRLEAMAKAGATRAELARARREMLTKPQQQKPTDAGKETR